MHPASDASLWVDRQLPHIAGAAKKLGYCKRIRSEWEDEVRLILDQAIRLCLTPAPRRPADRVEFDRCTKQEGCPSKARAPALLTLRDLRYVALRETAGGFQVRPGIKIKSAAGKHDWRLLEVLYGPDSAMAKLARQRG